jgi:vacuolar protein sorting-associated protein 16
VYHVLLHLHKRLALGTFFRLLEEDGHRLAPAIRLLEVYARAQNREMLRDFYYSDDRRVESAVLCLEEAAAMQVRFVLESVLVRVNFGGLIALWRQDPAAKIQSVKAAQKFFSEDKDHAFEAKV